MQIKLVETSGHEYRKVRRNVEKMLSSLSGDGFEFSLSRTIDKNKYESHYKGFYNNKPFTLIANTTHRELDSGDEDVFFIINLDGKMTPLGAAHSLNKNELYELLEGYFNDENPQQAQKEEPNEKEQKDDEEGILSLSRLRAKQAEYAKQDEELASEPQEDKKEAIQVDTESVGKKIVEIVGNYGVKMNYETATVGPAITQYEFKLSPGTKISELVGLNQEIALGLEVKSVAIGSVEGKSTIGIQVPNSEVTSVSLDEVLQASEKKGVSVALGKDLNGNAINADILDMQHVLIGGSTGSGKSSAINSMLTSIIQQYSPDQVKLVLVDPKKVELSSYAGLPHLLRPIITDPSEADNVLKEVTKEMDNRYSRFAKVGVKNIKGYNNLVEEYNKDHQDKQKLMPYIVVVIDELADLMMTAGKSVESSIQRITQLARAAGIHMIVATQRPSADIVTGPIKANIASRISFATASNTDSRVILDQGGAEKLLGKGDMLFKPVGQSNPKRIQGAYVTDEQVDSIVNKVKNQYGGN